MASSGTSWIGTFAPIPTLCSVDYPDCFALPHSKNFLEEDDQGPYVQLFIPRGRECIRIGTSLLDFTYGTPWYISQLLVGFGLYGSLPIHVRIGLELYTTLLEVQGHLHLHQEEESKHYQQFAQTPYKHLRALGQVGKIEKEPSGSFFLVSRE